MYEILHDIKCGRKPTSCAAELAKALKEAHNKEIKDKKGGE